MVLGCIRLYYGGAEQEQEKQHCERVQALRGNVRTGALGTHRSRLACQTTCPNRGVHLPNELVVSGRRHAAKVGT